MVICSVVRPPSGGALLGHYTSAARPLPGKRPPVGYFTYHHPARRRPMVQL